MVEENQVTSCPWNICMLVVVAHESSPFLMLRARTHTIHYILQGGPDRADVMCWDRASPSLVFTLQIPEPSGPVKPWPRAGKPSLEQCLPPPKSYAKSPNKPTKQKHTRRPGIVAALVFPALKRLRQGTHLSSGQSRLHSKILSQKRKKMYTCTCMYILYMWNMLIWMYEMLKSYTTPGCCSVI